MVVAGSLFSQLVTNPTQPNPTHTLALRSLTRRRYNFANYKDPEVSELRIEDVNLN